jgi:hypothetical protein
MKKIVLILMCAATTAMATGQESAGVGQNNINAKAIYKALDVKAVAENSGIAGSSREVKSVGGLTCDKSRIVVPGSKDSYGCSIEQSLLKSELIYKALKVKEVALNPGIAGSSEVRKRVGGLTCVRSLVIYPGAVPSYSCTTIVDISNSL